MPPTIAERNRILATLASRTGLTRADVVATVLADLADEGEQTLADVLEHRGLLGADERTLLEGLVDASLRANGGDSELVLAGLGPTQAGEGTLAGPGDRTALSPTSGKPGPAPGAAATERFRETRLHARGALGEVFVAHDGELNREVALKRIQARHADHAGHMARFLVEAEVTGGLEHPGIVPVYSLGAGPDGRPYYAMRFIRGESLEAAIEEFHRADLAPGRDPAGRTLGLRKLLARLIDVCQAMAYAHSRGVLHRDLKPANIMLGKFGETLIVDWGLARLQGSAGVSAADGENPLTPASAPDRSATEAGSIFGTPAFMSPEQAAGEIDRLGPASDVYGLGAILYALLAGRSPFGGTSISILLEQVRRGEFTPPRAVRPDVPIALEAVCLKAMALKPEDRYPSTLALADELEHWLADEPVSARREPWIDRLSRWRRRHRTLVTAASAVLVATAVALACGALAINAERAVAVAERDRAEGEFRRARRAVDDSFTRVSEDVLLNAPGLQPLRKELLLAARGYYEEFLRDRGADPALRAELAQTQSRLGQIADALGEKDEALRSFEAAARIRESLAADRPDDPGISQDLAQALSRLGTAQVHRSGTLQAARRNFERAIGLLESPGNQPGDRARLRSVLGGLYGDLGVVSQLEGRAGEAVPLLHRARAIREELVRDHPDQPALRSALAQTLIAQSSIYKQVGPSTEVIATSERAVDLFEGLHRERPEAAVYTFELAVALASLGRFEFYEGAFAGARRHLGRAEDLLATLVRENPRAIAYAVNLGSLGNGLAQLDRREGRPDLAARHVGIARDLFEGLIRDHPNQPEYHEALSQSWNLTGRLALADGRRPEARAAFDRAATLLADLPDQLPTHLYNFACNTALGLPLPTDDPAGPGRAEVDQRASRAVQALSRAVAAGMTNVELYLRDDDLDPLRARDDFRSFLAGLLDRGFPPDPFAR